MKEKILFFTKAPKLGYGKSRLEAFLSEEERLDLSRQLILENYKILTLCEKDLILYYTGDKKDLSFIQGEFKVQEGQGLGERMKRALYKELETSDKVILIGSDLYGVTTNLVQGAFEALEEKDFVISPTRDGGYGLIGLRKKADLFSGIQFSRGDVFENTLKRGEDLGLSWKVLGRILDIDTLKDLVCAEENTEDVQLLGQGEYNINYLVNHEYVFRINLGSQLHLGKEQIPYEYKALKELEESGATVKAYRWEERGKYIPLPFLTMEYVEGRPLDYGKDLKIAAYLLAKVHSLETEGSSLILAKNPFQEMYQECRTMYGKYKGWEDRDPTTEAYLDKFISVASRLGLDEEIEKKSIINTELNNRNFIIGNKNVVIDWEKPLIGEKEQDLAHFMVPTTTNWKTDKILSDEERAIFLKEYEKYNRINRDKLGKYFVFNCLRGLTWSSMAKVEYTEASKALVNEDTLEKINLFLGEDFLREIEKNYFEVYYGYLEEA